MNKKNYFYIFLGVGIGFIISGIFFELNPKIVYKEYSDSEIIDKAEEMGMVFLKDSISVNKGSTQQDKEKEEIKFTIKKDEPLSEIADNLKKLKIIDDEDEFIQFAKDKKLDKKILPGVYYLKKDMSYTSIMNMLTSSK